MLDSPTRLHKDRTGSGRPCRNVKLLDRVPALFHIESMASAIKNLGQAVRHSMVLKVTCETCGHAAHFLAGDVAQFVDPGKPLTNLPFRCHECRGAQCTVVAMEVDRDRHPKIVVWRPVRF